ncbi:GNAT family N-acetyltransferase [Streptomyces sp. NPDC057702]|uniref:GNAT family N-acetyltransferase n=1 Tax=unclassified Streptomyces TaxID=2593676 RepID=UPI00367EFC75
MEFTTGGRLEVRISPADVGKRVSVRRLNDPGGGPQKFTDTVGVLTSWTGGVVRITRKNGEDVRIAEATLVAGKVIPPAPGGRPGVPPTRRRGPATDAYELDRVAARAWPPADRLRLAPAGADPTAGLAAGAGWELRAAGGFTRRANSVLPLGDPGLPLDEALRRVRAWYDERGLPTYVHVSRDGAGGQQDLATELARRGWTNEGTAEVWTAALAPVADRDPAPFRDPDGIGGAPSGSFGGAAGPGTTGLRAEVSRTVSDAWLARYQRFGEPVPESLTVLTGGPSVWFATVWEESDATGDPGDVRGPGTAGGGEAVAIGRCVVDGRWAGFTAVEVAPSHRRRGLASAVMAALSRAALAEGASAAYLQVEADNARAHALYDGLGFRVHHPYHYFRAPRGDAR